MSAPMYSPTPTPYAYSHSMCRPPLSAASSSSSSSSSSYAEPRKRSLDISHAHFYTPPSSWLRPPLRTQRPSGHFALPTAYDGDAPTPPSTRAPSPAFGASGDSMPVTPLLAPSGAPEVPCDPQDLFERLAYAARPARVTVRVRSACPHRESAFPMSWADGRSTPSPAVSPGVSRANSVSRRTSRSPRSGTSTPGAPPMNREHVLRDPEGGQFTWLGWSDYQSHP